MTLTVKVQMISKATDIECDTEVCGVMILKRRKINKRYGNRLERWETIKDISSCVSLKEMNEEEHFWELTLCYNRSKTKLIEPGQSAHLWLIWWNIALEYYIRKSINWQEIDKGKRKFRTMKLNYNLRVITQDDKEHGRW